MDSERASQFLHTKAPGSIVRQAVQEQVALSGFLQRYGHRRRSGNNREVLNVQIANDKNDNKSLS